jgi:hypothetical protein
LMKTLKLQCSLQTSSKRSLSMKICELVSELKTHTHSLSRLYFVLNLSLSF